MDYQIFLVRQPTAGPRANKWVTKILRVSENGFSLSPVTATGNNPMTPTEYRLENLVNVLPSSDDSSELTMDINDSTGRSETLRLFCTSRTALLTALLNKIDDANHIGTDFFLKKHSNQRGGLADSVLRVRSASLVKMVSAGVRYERRKVNPAKKFNFSDIMKIETLSDDEHVVLIYFKSRVMRVTMRDSMPFLQAVQQNMKNYLDRDFEICKITTKMMVENISSYVRRVKQSSVIYEFEALKRLEADKQDRQRLIVVTKEYFIEKSGDEVTGVHSLSDVLGVVVSKNDPREVIIEFKSWRATQYFVEARDELIASLVFVMDMMKTFIFSIHLEPSLPYTFPEILHPYNQNECETYYISQLMSITNQSVVDQPRLLQVLREYACNIHLGESQCSDPQVLVLVTNLLQNCKGDYTLGSSCCLVIQKLLGSRACYEGVKNMAGFTSTLFQTMRMENSVLAYLATVSFRTAIKLSLEPGSADITQFLKMELANKVALLSSDNVQQIFTLLHTLSSAKNTSLQIYGLVDLIYVSLCTRSSEIESSTPWLKVFENCILAAADVLCKTFRTSSEVVFRSNSLLLKAILTKSSLVSSHMQKLCLQSCALLMHLDKSIFSQDKETRTLSGNLVYLMIEGNKESRKLLEALLPKGVMHIYSTKVSQMSYYDKEAISTRFPAWMETLETLRKGTFKTPILVWNDVMRAELRKFLREEVDAFYDATTSNHKLVYNSTDVQLVYSSSEAEGSIVGGLHLELLVDLTPPPGNAYQEFWKIKDPLSTFQSIFQSMMLGFTPFFGQHNLPEVDLRLAAHSLTWIFERHAEEVYPCLQTLHVIEVITGMLRDVIETEHQVFVFKLVVFLLATLETGGREIVLRFLKAGGATVLVPLIVLSLAKCTNDKFAFECDAWRSKAISVNETVQVRLFDGIVKLVRVPSGRSHEFLDRVVQDGSLDAKEAIHWKAETVHEKIQLGMALDLLEAILRISGSEGNVDLFPPSSACHHLAREEVLCHLVQSLLRAKRPVFGRILDILSYVVKVNTTAMKRLYKLGAFEILLWKLLAGGLGPADRTSIVVFIRESHLHQDLDLVFNAKEYFNTEEHSPWHASILRLYFPDGLILKLMSEDAEIFCSLLDTDNDTPEVIWNAEMRDGLLEYLTNELESYVKFRASDALALYIHVAKAPFTYPELEESTFSAPFYLHNLLDKERFANYQIKDPQNFLNNLTQDIKRLAADMTNPEPITSSSPSWRKELSHIHLLFEALGYLLEHFPELPLPIDLETPIINLSMPALQICMAQEEESPLTIIDVLHQSMVILRRYSACTTTQVEVPKASLNFCLSVLSLGTRLTDKEEGTLEPSQNFNIESAVAGSLLALVPICSSRSGKEMMQTDMRWRKGFWWALCSAAEDATANPPKGPSMVSFAALNCLKCYSEDEKYCDQIITQAWYLPLVLLVSPTVVAIAKDQDPKSAILYSAADVLGSLIRKQCESNKRLVLSRLIPKPMIASLERGQGPEKFMAMAASNFAHPEGIWSAEVREELRQKVSARLQQHTQAIISGTPLEGDELEWMESFELECLQQEALAAGLYIRGLSSGDWEGFKLPKGHAYLDAIQDNLTTYLKHLSPLTSEEQMETPDSGDDLSNGAEVFEDSLGEDEMKDFLCILSALRQCLKYAVKSDRKDLILELKHWMLTDVVFSGTCLVEVQIEIALIIKTLIEHEAGRKLVLESNLMKALATQLWQGAAEYSKEKRSPVLMVSLEAILSLSELMPATIAATNRFTTSGLMFPLIALFAKVPLPPIFNRERHSEGKIEELHSTSQLLAAQILGQLLLAGSGISRRSKLLVDLQRAGLNGVLNRSVSSLHRSNSGLRRNSLPNTHITTTPTTTTTMHPNVNTCSTDGIEEATDMYQLLNIVEYSVIEKRDNPLVIRTLLLLLPIDLLSILARNPSKACDVYEGHHWSPRLVWDKGARLRLEATIAEEAQKLHSMIVNKGSRGIPEWYLSRSKPVFLRWALATVSENGDKPLYKDSEDPDYACELYLGGFYIDQFLRNPEFDFGVVFEDRFLTEVRKAVVVGAPMEGLKVDEMGFDDKRRLLLALLLLFKLRPALLSRHSKIDIFLPIFEFITPHPSNSGGSSNERRGLSQIAILLFHCTATHPDIADYMSSEELVLTLSSFLDLDVPSDSAGFAGTDPRVCALMLLLRLVRLSSTTIEHSLRLGIVSKLASMVSYEAILSQQAAECLALMCNDKKKGPEVVKLLNSSPAQSHSELWSIPITDIRDEVVNSRVLNHFLHHRYPSSWWVTSL